MKKSIYIFFLSLYSILTSQYSQAQQNKIDSLIILVKSDKDDTNKVNHLNKLCTKYGMIGNYKDGLHAAKQALALAQHLSPMNFSVKKGISIAYNNMGLICYYQGNYPEALKNYFSALKVKEEIRSERPNDKFNKQNIASSYNNIGGIYANQHNYPEALKNHLISLKIYEELNDKNGIAALYNNIGNIYMDDGNNEKALKNYLLALEINEEMENKNWIANNLINIGIIYNGQGKYDEALKKYLAALKLQEEVEDKDGVATCYINIGIVLIKLKNLTEASLYLHKALSLGREIGNKLSIMDSYKGLTFLDSSAGNYRSAFEYHKLYVLYRDSLDNEETKKKTIQSQMTYEFEKKEIAAKAEQEKLDAVTGEEKQKQNIIIYSTTGVLMIVIIFSLFLFNRFRITQRQKKVIEEQKILVDKAYENLHEKNKEVMDSIYYARRIQRALITSEKYIAAQLNKLIP